MLASGGGPGVGWWRVLGALVLCLLLAVGAAVVLKARLGGGGSAPRWLARGEPSRLRVVERVALGPQSSVALIAVDGREMLVAFGPGGATLLELPASSPLDEPPS